MGLADSNPSKRRLSAVTARLMLAREMWCRERNHDGDYSFWDDDILPTATYESYIARADKVIREAMEVGQ